MILLLDNRKLLELKRHFIIKMEENSNAEKVFYSKITLVKLNFLSDLSTEFRVLIYFFLNFIFNYFA